MMTIKADIKTDSRNGMMNMTRAGDNAMMKPRMQYKQQKIR